MTSNTPFITLTPDTLFALAVNHNHIDDNSSIPRRNKMTLLQRLAEMMDIIDDIFLFGGDKKDGDYLKLVNSLKELRIEFKKRKTRLLEEPIMMNAMVSVRRRNMSVKTHQERLNSGKWKNCGRCNRFIKKTEYDDHIARSVCIQFVEKLFQEDRKNKKWIKVGLVGNKKAWSPRCTRSNFGKHLEVKFMLTKIFAVEKRDRSYYNDSVAIINNYVPTTAEARTPDFEYPNV